MPTLLRVPCVTGNPIHHERRIVNKTTLRIKFVIKSKTSVASEKEEEAAKYPILLCVNLSWEMTSSTLNDTQFNE